MRSFLLLALFWGLTATAHAQNAYNGSLYSRYGLGELVSFPSSRASALGGGGYALSTPAYSSFANPAALSNQVLTRLSLGGYVEGIEITDAFDNQTRLSDGALGAVQLSFPVTDFKVGVGIQYAPYTRVSYQVRQPGRLLDPATRDTIDYTVGFEGSGGLHRVDIGVGVALSPTVRVGATVGGVFGLLEDRRRTTFSSASYLSTTLNNTTRLSGVIGSVGVIGRVPGVGAENNALAFGATFTSPVHLVGRRVRSLGETIDTDTLTTSNRGAMDLPFSVAGGVSYSVGSRWTFLVDGRYEPWSSFDSDFALDGYTPGGESRFTDRVRVSGGVEVIPAGNRPFGPFLSRVAYRLGASYDQRYVTHLNGDKLNTYALTGGVSLPTLLAGTQLDLNVEVGTRGEAQGNLVRDRYYRIGLVVNIGERWFERQKLR